MKRNVILSLIGFIILIGCHHNKMKDNSHEDDIISENLQNDNYILDSIIAILVHDEYIVSIDTSRNSTFDLFYSKDKRSMFIDTLKIPVSRQIKISAKRKRDIGNNFYPRFSITEMNFNGIDIDSIMSIKNKLESIINNENDILNEKEYDRLECFEGRIFYITTNAKIFEDYVIKYDNKLKDIINVR